MDPLLGGLIAGGASLIGNIFGSETSAQNTQAQIAANQQMVQQQMAFQERMSNTAYQRASQDMQKAGLNPVMMFGSGQAASTPGGSSISQTVNRSSPWASLGENVGKVVSTAVQMKTMDKMSDEMANLKTENEKLQAQVKTETMQPSRVAADIGLTEAETRKLRALMPQIENASRTSANQLDIDKAVRKALDVGAFGGTQVGKTIAPALDTLSSATGAGRLFKDIWRDRIDRGY